MSYSRSMWIATVVLQLLLLRSVAGQGLFLSLRGTPIDADGFVDVDEIGSYDYWNNPDGLLCHTNQSVRAGAWQFPNGTVTPTISDVRRDHGGIGFGRDRGPTGVLGVVRLSQLGNPSERGRFRCEIFGNTTNVNILDIGSVSTSSASTVTAGQPVTLQCSVAITPHPLPVNASTPVFEWFFGPTFNQPLTPTTTTNSGSTYTSTYSITSAMESDEGMYICRLRGNQRTAVSTMVTIEPAPITTPPPPPMVTASITASGTNTAGETYSLVCSVTVTGSTIQPTITWSGPMNNPVPSEMVSADGSMSTLTFSPLSASHAGTYTCRAEADGEMVMDTEIVTVQNPPITVSVDTSVATPMAGSMYSLTCTVTGAERLTGSTITYQWFKDGVMVSGQTMETFSFTSLSFSDAGRYTCQATVMSSLLVNGPITTNSSNSVDVTLTLPTPTVSITSNPTGVVTIGFTVTLTCTVELSPSVDVPVTVNTVWTGPAGFMTTNTARPVTGSTSTYISTAMVSSFGRDQSGDYTCTATVSSMSSIITNNVNIFSSIRLIVGIPPPLNVEASQASPSDPVEVSWSPPSDGATTITGYRIFYGNGKNGSLPSAVTFIHLDLNVNLVGQTVSLCTEAEQLASQCLNVTVEDTGRMVTDSSTASTNAIRTCTMETGIAVGVTVIVLLLVAVVIVITVVLCWWQRNKKSSLKLNKKDNFAVSANIAYGEVKLESTVKGDLYEEPDRVVRSDQGHYELTEHPPTTTSPPAAPVYDTVEGRRAE